MMPQESNRLWLLGTQVFAIIAVLLGVVGQETRLRSSRPASSSLVAEGVKEPGDDSVSKRLWEDPLEALNENREADKKRSPDSGDCEPVQVSIPVAKSGEPASQVSTLILTVAIDGESTPEAREVRLRSRYAISSALASAGYWSKTQKMQPFCLVPEPSPFPNWLQALIEAVKNSLKGRMPGVAQERGGSMEEPRAQSPVPRKLAGRWERFEFLGTGTGENRPERISRRGDRPNRTAYVVWVDKAKIPADKVTPARLRESLEAEFCKAGHVHGTTPFRSIFFHLGDSDDYVDFAYNPASLWKENPGDVASFEAHFLRATIPDETARLFARRLYGDRWKDHGYWLRLWRPNLSDADTAKAIVNELCLRVPRLNAERREGEPRPRVVVLIESDTLYSRAITEELQKLFRDKKVNLECRTYLRGLDGNQADQKRNADSSSGSGSGGKSGRYETPTHAISEPAQGTSQLDYLRLMAQHLARDEERPGVPKIAAVGVLGSDRWDKMLVLQAVRPELPSAVFFTTDLDTLYFQRDYQHFTRNLVVASAAGLVPKVPVEMPEITWRLPPLRDCYQKILVEQTWHALRGPRTDHPLDTAEKFAKVYEIAAGQEVEQTPSPGDLPFLRWLNDTMAAWARELYFLATFVGLGLLGCIMLVERQRGRKEDEERDREEEKERKAGAGPPPPDVAKAGNAVGGGAARKAVQGKARAKAGIEEATDAGKAPGTGAGTGEAGGASRPGMLAQEKERCLRFVDELLNDTRLPALANGVLGLVKVLGVTMMTLLLLAFLFDWNLGLEDVAWASGTSIWPSILIRLVAFMLAISLLKTALRDHEARRRELSKALETHLGTAFDQVNVPLGIRYWELLRQSVGLPPLLGPAMTPEGKPQRTMEKIFVLVRSRRSRICRVAVFAMVYLLLSGWLFSRWPTFVPARGDFAFVVERFILLLGVAMYIVHLVFCIDLHLSALHLIRALKVLARWDRSPMKKPGSINWSRILMMVADFTASVGRTLLYPLMVLLLMIVSRFRIFDNWTMHPSLMITFGIGAVSLLGVALVLVFSARELRQLCLAAVKEKQQASKEAEWEDKASVERYATERDDIEKLNAGAFARWYEQPVVVALASFIGVFGSTAVADPLLRLLVGG